MYPIDNKTDGISSLGGEEYTSHKDDNLNAIIASGQTPTLSDAFQQAKANSVAASSGDFYTDTGSLSAVNLFHIVPRANNVTPHQLEEGTRVRFIPANEPDTTTVQLKVGSFAALEICDYRLTGIAPRTVQVGFFQTNKVYTLVYTRIPGSSVYYWLVSRVESQDVRDGAIGNDQLAGNLSLDKFSEGELNFTIGDYEFFFSPQGLTMYHGASGVRKIIRLQPSGAGTKPTITIDKEGQTSDTIITNEKIDTPLLEAADVDATNVEVTSLVSATGGTENPSLGANTGLIIGDPSGLQITVTKNGTKNHGAGHPGIGTIVRRSSTYNITSLINSVVDVYTGTADGHRHQSGQRVQLTSTLDTGIPLGARILGLCANYIGVDTGAPVACTSVEALLLTFASNIGVGSFNIKNYSDTNLGFSYMELIDPEEPVYLTIDYDASDM